MRFEGVPGDVSAGEVLEAHLQRIREVNPRLNAVVDLAEDEARAAAAEAGRRLEQGRPVGPLHGVPFTVKDWIEVAHKLGAGVIRVFAGRQVPKGHTFEQALEWMIPLLAVAGWAAFGPGSSPARPRGPRTPQGRPRPPAFRP